MMKNNSRILVLGGGKTGASLCRYFIRQGCRISVYDTRVEPPEIKTIKNLSSDIRFMTGELDPDIVREFDLVAVSPGISMHDPLVVNAKKSGKEVIGDLELLYRSRKDKGIIAITGSNGKSTVTALVHAILCEAGIHAEIGGNFGTPVLDLDSKAEVFVLEVSSFQLELIKDFTCEVGMVLNVSPDHLDRYRNFDEYRLIKERLYLHTEIPVINQDDKDMRRFITNRSIV
ncbi:MAG: UDP-N-acetylmuramoyl-L-alanine--D-glutamate ligase, partial [Gammaproteobacteria bacterium]